MKRILIAVSMCALMFAVGCSKTKDDKAAAAGSAQPAAAAATTADTAAAAAAPQAAPTGPTNFPPEVREAIGRMTATINTSADKLEKAKTEQDVAAALTSYAQQMQAHAKEAKALEAKYPNLMASNKEEFDSTSAAIESATQRFATAISTSIQKYPNSQPIMKAYEQISQMGNE